jgi:hypothetical protein
MPRASKSVALRGDAKLATVTPSVDAYIDRVRPTLRGYYTTKTGYGYGRLPAAINNGLALSGTLLSGRCPSYPAEDRR